MARATILPLNHSVKFIEDINLQEISINDLLPKIQIKQSLPFRVRFTSINIEGYSPNNPPPIPLQVIGYSNYIL